MSQLVEFLAGSLEPVSLEAARANCRVDFADDDAWIGGTLIPAARQAAEVRSGACIRPARWVQRLPAFPKLGQPIALTHSLIATVEAVTYLPAGTPSGSGAPRGSLQSGTDFEVIAEDRETLLAPIATDWPTAGQSPRAVEVTYTAGLSPADFAQRHPAALQWILLAIAWAYEHRTLFIEQGYAALPDAYARTLLDTLTVRPRF